MDQSTVFLHNMTDRWHRFCQKMLSEAGIRKMPLTSHATLQQPLLNYFFWLWQSLQPGYLVSGYGKCVFLVSLISYFCSQFWLCNHVSSNPLDQTWHMAPWQKEGGLRINHSGVPLWFMALCADSIKRGMGHFWCFKHREISLLWFGAILVHIEKCLIFYHFDLL